MNNNVFNNGLFEPLGSIEPYYFAAQHGYFYTITTGNQVVTEANGFFALQLVTQNNSGKTIRIQSVQVSSQVAITINIYRNATLNVSGTSLTPRNTNWGSPDASVVTGSWVSQASDPTSGGVLLQAFNQVEGITELDFDGRHVIPSMATNQQYYILVQSSVANSPVSINVSWWEL
jgi:hypothetical protein